MHHVQNVHQHPHVRCAHPKILVLFIDLVSGTITSSTGSSGSMTTRVSAWLAALPSMCRRPLAADEAKGYYLAYNSVGIIKRGGTQRCHWEAERNTSIRLVVAGESGQRPAVGA